MSNASRLAEADRLLRLADAPPESLDASNTWRLFLRLLLSGTAAETDVIKDVLDSAPFATPRTLAGMTTGQLVELLEGVPRGPQKSGVLRAVAEWWLGEFGEECCPEWRGSLEDYRQALRRIRGLGPATVDELLLLAAGLSVFPVDRGTIRVAIRHGWLDLPVEDEEAQSLFVGGLRDAGVDAPQFSQLLSRVAASYCGREPKCDGCPLQPLLPQNGPLNPDAA